MKCLRKMSFVHRKEFREKKWANTKLSFLTTLAYEIPVSEIDNSSTGADTESTMESEFCG